MTSDTVTDAAESANVNVGLILRLRGWAVSREPEALAEGLWGEGADRLSIATRPGWRVERPISAGEPVGPIRDLLVAASAGEISFVPGSHGQPQPPSMDAQGSVVSVALEAGQSLLLDARCWWLSTPGARADLWFSPTRP